MCDCKKSKDTGSITIVITEEGDDVRVQANGNKISSSSILAGIIEILPQIKGVKEAGRAYIVKAIDNGLKDKMPMTDADDECQKIETLEQFEEKILEALQFNGFKPRENGIPFFGVFVYSYYKDKHIEVCFRVAGAEQITVTGDGKNFPDVYASIFKNLPSAFKYLKKQIEG